MGTKTTKEKNFVNTIICIQYWLFETRFIFIPINLLKQGQLNSS